MNFVTIMAALTVISYNSTGTAEDKIEYIKQIIANENVSLVLLQETWLLSKDAHQILNSVHPDFGHHAVSGVPDDGTIIHGRPYGGVAILYNKYLAKTIEHVQVDSNRICAIKLIFDNRKDILVICVYLPNDTYSKTIVDQTYLECLDTINVLIERNSDSEFIIAGDMNTDTCRQNMHSRMLEDYMEQMGAYNTWKHSLARQTYTFRSPLMMHGSCIDYIYVSQDLFNNVQRFETCDDDINRSFHDPVILTLKMEIPKNTVKTIDRSHSRVAWHKCTAIHLQEYAAEVDNQLSQLQQPLCLVTCKNVECACSDHKNMISIYSDQILQICFKAGEKHLPHTKNKAKCLPHWTRDVKPLRDDLLFWGKIWRECGKPNQGTLYDVYKKIKLKYHYKIREIKKNVQARRRERMAEAISLSQDRDLWSEVRKIKRSCKVNPPNIDGIVDKKLVCEKFASQYKELYNSVPSNYEKMKEIKLLISEGIKNHSEPAITQREIQESIKLLHKGKSDGNGMVSDYIINGPICISNHIAMLLNAMLIHGCTPGNMLLSTGLSIPKNVNKSLSDSTNYRGITLASCLCKLLDIVTVLRYEDKLRTSDLQFSFKKRHSTTMCTLLVKEIVNYYINNGNSVFVCMLDASKAFDRVRYDSLFRALLERDIPCVFLRLLMDSYERQQMRVTWSSEFSECFTVGNGVRQGGVLSPILFTVYMDLLIKQLSAKGIGCHIGDKFCGAAGYADDLTLISPTIWGLQEMINVCEQFGIDFDLCWNPEKTICIPFKKGRLKLPLTNVHLNGKQLPWQASAKHLGNTIQWNLSEDLDVHNKRCEFASKCNSLTGQFQFASKETLTHLFATFCCSFYGCQTWRLEDKHVSKFITTWNIAVRRIWTAPRMTHRKLLTGLISGRSAMQQFESRFVKMLDTLKSAHNTIWETLLSHCLDDSQSIIGSNVKYIQTEYDISDHLPTARELVLIQESRNKDHSAESKILKEMLLVKNGELIIPGFNTNEMLHLIDTIATQ